MDDASLADLLRRFGFSEKEIDTYLTILKLGEAKAKNVADEADVSKRHVYSVAETLEDRGFVEVNDHVVPTTIKANPVEEVVEKLSSDLDRIQPALESRFSQATPHAEPFRVIKSRVTILKRISELIDQAEIEIMLALPYRLLHEVADELEDAFERDILMLLLATDVDPSDDLRFDGLASVARAWNQPMPAMLTVDRKAGLVSPPELLSQANSTTQAIEFAQEQIGPIIIGSFLGNYFQMATEMYVAEPAGLPVTYTNFRHAVFQVVLHSRAGTEIRANIVGRSLHDEDDQTELSGTVVDFRQSLLEPSTSSFPVENTLTVETAEGVYSVGGQGAFVEDFEASSVELRLAEDAE